MRHSSTAAELLTTAAIGVAGIPPAAAHDQNAPPAARAARVTAEAGGRPTATIETGQDEEAAVARVPTAAPVTGDAGQTGEHTISAGRHAFVAGE
ncbi:hypothetical protein [Nonomuraea sp. NPDC050643]|uniref:hypothetical protein n=1 Tax=Nonomuraea sp. NPDC050643 TaxID=3155660 RepID=UPI0033E9FBC8